MGKGTSTQQTQQTQNSTTDPWGPSVSALNGILGGINSQVGNYQPTSAETGALNVLRNNAAATPNYAPQAASLANDLFSGGPDRTGIVNDAYSQYKQQLSPYANGANLDPRTAPGMSDLLDSIRNDVSTSVNGMFAGAGRDLSGLNQQTLARGLSQGLAAPLLAQYNQNVQNQLGAAGNLFNAGGTAAGVLSGLDQQSLANRAAGVSVAGSAVPGLQDLGAQRTLAAENTARSLPLSNLGLLANLTIPIAGLGSAKQGTASGTQENTMSDAQQAWGWMGAGGNLFKSLFPGGF